VKAILHLVSLRAKTIGAAVVYSALAATTAFSAVTSVGNYTMGTNGTITVPVLISDATGVAGVDLTLRYNSGLLSPRSVTTGALTSDYYMKYNTNVAGEVRISLARSTGLASGTGTLVNIAFDVSGAAQVGNTTPLTLTVANLFNQQAESVTSSSGDGVFTVQDSDGNGLPDVWKQRIVAACTNGTITCIHDVRPEDDFDGDGVRNGDEYAADTDPTDATSFLAVTDIAVDGTRVHIGWQGGVWANQRLEASDDLTAGPAAWRCIRTNTPPTSPTGSATDTGPIQDSIFYRIKVQR
jgi:hypothetical protein